MPNAGGSGPPYRVLPVAARGHPAGGSRPAKIREGEDAPRTRQPGVKATDQSSPEEAGERDDPPARFVPWQPTNSRVALELSLASGSRPPLPDDDEPGAPLLVRQSIRLLVRLATTVHGLSIQRRILTDVFGDAPEQAVLAAVNARVQAASSAITRRCVAGLASISEAGVRETSWHDLIVKPADVALVEATADPEAAIERLPAEIADDLAAALALDRADARHAAPFLVRGAGNAVALFVIAGMPHPPAP